MSTIGYGYGSEWHLLRYLGYHRQVLDEAVLGAVGGDDIVWLDCPFQPKARFLDAEWKGLDFLDKEHSARKAWPAFWPTQGNVQNWDAVGRIHISGNDRWLLVEAKGHLGEIKSSCGAKKAGGLDRISSALETTKEAIGIDSSRDWLSPYYQFANRMATLHHLHAHGVDAHLINIYFLGDSSTSGVCPEVEADWQTELDAMYRHLGVDKTTPLKDRVHTLFLPVCPGGQNYPLQKTPIYSPQARGST